MLEEEDRWRPEGGKKAEENLGTRRTKSAAGPDAFSNQDTSR